MLTLVKFALRAKNRSKDIQLFRCSTGIEAGCIESLEKRPYIRVLIIHEIGSNLISGKTVSTI